MINRYLDRIALQKQASLSGLALWHLGQNSITKGMLHSKAVGKHIANAFQQGLAGTHEGSLKRKLTSAVTSIASPEIEAMYRTANKVGHDLKDKLPSLHPRAKVGLRQISEGRFNDFDKLRGRMRLSAEDNHLINHVAGRIEKEMKVPIKSIMDAPATLKAEAQRHWSSNKHPLLSNIASTLSRGNPIATKPVAKNMRQATPLATQAVTAAIDAPGAAINAAKTSTLIDSVKNNKYFGKAVNKVEDYFTKHQAELGAAKPGVNRYKGGLKNAFNEYVVNPMSASIKNTSATMADIVNRAKTPGGE